VPGTSRACEAGQPEVTRREARSAHVSQYPRLSALSATRWALDPTAVGQRLGTWVDVY
jgi:hypothetical protein